MNNSSSLYRVPFSLHTDIAHPSEYEGAYPHGEVRYRCQSTRGRDVEFENVCHVFGEVGYHCVVTPVVANLEDLIEAIKKNNGKRFVSVHETVTTIVIRFLCR